tara:strand:+ start:1447 stop:2190 length:744 start_codon:yes stop_codon:yes gene_type:complete
MVIIISVDGNIGSGKSTFVAQLKKQLRWIKNMKIIYLQEPVKEWESFVDKATNENILQKFYTNPDNWSFSFQMMAYISRVAQLKNIITKHKNDNYVIITERSVLTDKNVFAKMLYDAKKIHDIDYQIYTRWFNEFTQDIKISGIIYVYTSAEKCHTRIVKRNRKGENIPIEYLKRCHEYHQNWLNSYDDKLIIDNEVDADSNNKLNIMKIELVKDFISDFIKNKDDVNVNVNECEVLTKNYMESINF